LHYPKQIEMSKQPNFFLLSVMIGNSKHNLSRSQYSTVNESSWSPVKEPAGFAFDAMLFTDPIKLQEMHKTVLKGITDQIPPYFRRGIDPVSLMVEGVFIEFREFDPRKLGGEEERLRRIMAQLSGADADFLKKQLLD